MQENIKQPEGQTAVAVDTAALYRVIAKAAKEAEHAPVTLSVSLPSPEYFLDEPFVLSAEQMSGLENVKLSLHSETGATFTDLVALDAGAFLPVPGQKYLCYRFAKGENGAYPLFREFYVDGKKIPMAGSEGYRNPFALGQRKNRPLAADDPMGLYVPLSLAEKLAQAPLSGTELHMYAEWEWYALRVKEIDFADRKEKDGESYVLVKPYPEEYEIYVRGINSCLDTGGRECFFRNALAFLSEPESFVYDYFHGLLYYMPPETGMRQKRSYAYPTLENLMICRGLTDFSVEGVTFRGTTSKRLCRHGYCSGQANEVKGADGGRLPHAALLTYQMRRFSLRNCRFSEIGAGGLLMRDSTVRAEISGCRFENIGMGALSVGNQTAAWEEEKNRNFAVSVVNNSFRHIGYDYPTATCIYIGMADGLKILHNTIEDTSYSAISVGWFPWPPAGEYERGEKVNIRDAEIAYNRIIDYMQLLRDGAAIYTMGVNCTDRQKGQFNRIHDNYAQRELYPDDSKRGYYLDGSSSNWALCDCVAVGTRLPVFSQFHVSSQFTHNNFIDNIYTDYPVDPGNHAPWRDTVLGRCYVGKDAAALFAAYPKAKEIFAASGCDRKD